MQRMKLRKQKTKDIECQGGDRERKKGAEDSEEGGNEHLTLTLVNIRFWINGFF